MKSILEASIHCKYCEASRLHAQRHARYDQHVLCNAHRTLQLLNYRVEENNPFNFCQKLRGLEYIEEKNIFKKRVQIYENIFLNLRIGKRVPILSGIAVKIKNFVFFPVISAEIKNGEYEERKFQTFFREISSEKWGILDDDFLVTFVGLSRLTDPVDTCVYQEASYKFYIETNNLFTQRDSCDECLYIPDFLFDRMRFIAINRFNFKDYFFFDYCSVRREFFDKEDRLIRTLGYCRQSGGSIADYEIIYLENE